MQPLPHFSGKKTLSLTDLETQREHIAALANKVEVINKQAQSPRTAPRFAYHNAAGLDVDFVAASSTGESMLTLSGGASQPYISQADIFGVINRVRALSMREIRGGWGNREHIYRGNAALPRAHCPEGVTDTEQAEASGVAVCGLMTALQWAPSGVTEPYIGYGVGYIPRATASASSVANYNISGVVDTVGSISSVSYNDSLRAANINDGQINISSPDSTASGVISWGAVNGVIATARAVGSSVITSVIDPGTPSASTAAWWRNGILCLNLDALGAGGVSGLVDINGSSVTWASLGDYDNPTTHTLLTSAVIGEQALRLYASKRDTAQGGKFLALTFS